MISVPEKEEAVIELISHSWISQLTGATVSDVRRSVGGAGLQPPCNLRCALRHKFRFLSDPHPRYNLSLPSYLWVALAARTDACFPTDNAKAREFTTLLLW